MPAPEKTPARRFLLPSNTAAPRSSSSGSARRPVPDFSQSNFASSSASPLARSSRFETPAARERDGIQTSFEIGSSPTLSTRQSHIAVKSDAIIDDTEDHGTREPGIHDVSNTTEEVGRPNPAVFHREDLDADILDSPSRKRRKLTSSARTPKPTITISSSPSASEHEDINLNQEEPDQPTSDVEDAALFELRTPQTTSRFRSVAPIHHTDRLSNVSKPAFRALSTNVRLDLEAGMVLPDAFSPSRRKGKREYDPGGLADTVRSWVLGAASEELQRGKRIERRLAVQHAKVDTNGRAVAATDDEGQQWLLIGRHDGMDRTSNRRAAERIQKEGSVVIRGASTIWAVADAEARQVQVAAHWDFPP